MAQELRILLDKSYKEKQFYWVRDKKGTNAEIDFVWQTPTQIIPIEVKAGTNSHLRSLHSYVNSANHHVTAVRFWSGEFSIQSLRLHPTTVPTGLLIYLFITSDNSKTF